MKFQFAVIDPDLVAKDNKTVIVGIAKSEQAINDYDLRVLSIIKAEHSFHAALVNRSENLKNRKYGSDESFGYNLSSLLTAPVWRTVEGISSGSGEITFLNTQSPEDDPSSPHFVILLGILTGDHEHLKELSGQIIEADFQKSAFDNDTNHAQLTLTGRKASHSIGTHFPDLLGQIIWGFDKEKYGMRFLNSYAESKKTFDALKSYIDTGVLTPEMRKVGISSDRDYFKYLKEVEKIKPLEFLQWEDTASRKEREAISKKAISRLMSDECSL